LDSVVLAEFRISLLKLVSSDLFRGSNKGVDAEDATTIDLFLFSDKLVEHEASFGSIFGGELEVEGSLAEEVDKTSSPLELISVRKFELELEHEWIEFAFRTVLLEDSTGVVKTSG